MLYRKLKPEDSKEYREIRLEALKNYPENFGWTFEEEKNKPKFPYETYIEEQATGDFIMGAYDDEKLIGICGFHQEQRKKTRHFGTIIQMHVKRDYTGKGIGRKLLTSLIEEAFKIQEIEQLLLGVVAGNKVANKLYESLGFQEYGLIKNYFKEGETYYDQRFMVLFRNPKIQ